MAAAPAEPGAAHGEIDRPGSRPWLLRRPRGAAADLRRWGVAAALLALTAYSTWVRWRFLSASPYPLGVDGYFYPIQLRALLEHGRLYYPASPLAFWLMAPLAALADPIVGAKLGAALGGAAVAWPAYGVGRRLGGDRVAGLTAAVVAVSSTGSLYLSVEFVKNGFGVTVGLTALWALLAAVSAPAARRWWLAAAALLAAVLTHKMATALVLLLGAPPLWRFGWQRWPARRSWLLLGTIAVVAGLAALGAVAPGRFLSPDHLTLLRGLYAGAWRWDAPALAIGRFELPLDGEGWKLGVTSLLGAAMLGASWATRRRAPAGRAAAPARPAAEALVGWLLIGLGLAVAWPGLAVDDPQGLGFRLRVIAFVPLALVTAVCVGEARAVLARLGAPAGWWQVAVGLGLVLWFGRAPTRLERGVVYAHPEMIAAVTKVAAVVPSGDTVVVSERHIAFMTTWYARARTSVRPDAGPVARRWRLMPLAFIGDRSVLARAIDAAGRQPQLVAPRGLHARHRHGLVLLPEATWQWILTQLPAGPRRYYQAWSAL